MTGRWGHQPGHLPLGPPPWLRRTRRRLSLWWRRRMFRLARCLWERLPQGGSVETAALQLLIAGLTLIVLFQSALLVLLRPR